MNRTTITAAGTVAIMAGAATVEGTAMITQNKHAQTDQRAAGAIPARLVNEAAARSLELAGTHLTRSEPARPGSA